MSKNNLKNETARSQEGLESSRDKEERLITVYRGSKFGEPYKIWAECDGYVLSDAAMDGYHEYICDGYTFVGGVNASLRHSDEVFRKIVDQLGGPDRYASEHSRLGTDFNESYGPKPATSWSTSFEKAQEFATSAGYVLQAEVPVGSVLNSNWAQGAEKEVLIANGTWATLAWNGGNWPQLTAIDHPGDEDK